MATTKKTTRTKKTTTKTTKKEVLSFWRTVVSLTPLGTLWRTAIFTALIIALVLLNLAQRLMWGPDYLLQDLGDTYTLSSALQFILFSGVLFALYDGLYVAVARRYPISRFLDRLTLVTLEAFVATIILVDAAFASTWLAGGGSILAEDVSVWFFVLLALLTPVRAFLGVSYIVATRGIKSVK